MDLNQVIRILNTFNEDELVSLNRAVVDQIKSQRSAQAAINRHLFRVGDVVSWNGRAGVNEGKITKVNRKKAIITVGIERWNVPLNMLTAV